MKTARKWLTAQVLSVFLLHAAAPHSGYGVPLHVKQCTSDGAATAASLFSTVSWSEYDSQLCSTYLALT